MFSLRLRLPLLALAITCPFVAPATAEDSTSPWSTASKSAARLIAAPGPDVNRYRAGLEIKLAPNTITYWRSPGESGVPPVFDFSQSRNLASAQVNFPAPQRIDEAGSEIFGYAGDVVLPIEVAPKELGKPVDLVLDLNYAACEKICIPVRATLQLNVPAINREQAQSIASAEAAVPHKLAAAEVARDVRIVPVAGAAKPTWRLTWRGASAAQDLFAEAPDLFFFETRRVGDDFLIVLADHPKGRLMPAEPVRFTVTGPQPVEFAAHLDGGAASP
jgi:DsbC/DsbD-like thiol-disulfide interchange protein